MPSPCENTAMFRRANQGVRARWAASSILYEVNRTNALPSVRSR